MSALPKNKAYFLYTPRTGMKKFFRTAFQAITVLTLLCLIPNLFIYKVSPAAFWPMGILGIGFLYMYCSLLICFIVSLFLFRKWSVFLLILLIIPVTVLKNVFGTEKPRAFLQAKPGSKSIRVMQWNCQGLRGISDYYPKDRWERKQVTNFLQQYKPDIICIQDFSEVEGKDIFSNIALMRDTLNYPYFIFSKHYYYSKSWGNTRIGIAIFSKYPIADSGIIAYPGKQFPESILWVDLQVADKRFRVGTTHFQSMYLHSYLGEEPLDSCHWEDSTAILHASFVGKLKYFQPYHVTQAAAVKSFVDTCHIPLVFTGDLNSVPSSYVYKQVRGKLSDAWLEKNIGLGRTYHSWQPALRIDYIFHNTAIRNIQTSLFRTSFSDHDPLLMDFEIK